MSVLILNKTKRKIDLKNFELIFNSIENKLMNKLNIKSNWEINLLIVNDDEIRNINFTTRGKKKVTDVLSFPLETKYDDITFLGDIIISIDSAEKQSKQMNNTLIEEMAFLFSHGLLHLLGYGHNNKKETKKMFELQNKILEGVI